MKFRVVCLRIRRESVCGSNRHACRSADRRRIAGLKKSLIHFFFTGIIPTASDLIRRFFKKSRELNSSSHFEVRSVVTTHTHIRIGFVTTSELIRFRQVFGIAPKLCAIVMGNIKSRLQDCWAMLNGASMVVRIADNRTARVVCVLTIAVALIVLCL